MTDWSLAQAREYVQEHREEGVRCPCCDQFAKAYRRALPSAAARVMIKIDQHSPNGDFVYLPPLLDTMKRTPHQGGYGTFSHHWDLIEAMPGERDDGSSRVGWWRLTDDGHDFVHDRLQVSKFVLLYNNRILGFEGPLIGIRHALGTKFDYRELMDGSDG
jgi:hypothetical protein